MSLYVRAVVFNFRQQQSEETAPAGMDSCWLGVQGTLVFSKRLEYFNLIFFLVCAFGFGSFQD